MVTYSLKKNSTKSNWQVSVLPCQDLLITKTGLRCIKKQNLKIPEQIAIIGFDGNEVFDFFYTPITFIEQPIMEMGKEAVRVLVNQINGTNEIAHIKLRHKLIKRQSSL